MSVKTAGVGHFTIPTAPAAGTSVTSGAANVFTTTYVQLIASTAAALYITGIYVEKAAASAATYCVIQLATGAAAAETIIGQHLIALSTGSTVALGYKPIFPPIPVPTGTRISCKSADSVGAQASLVTLECIAQTSVVDDGITVGTVALVNTLTTYTGNTPQTGDSFARLGAPAGASVSADVAAVKTDTAAIKVKTDFTPSVVAGAAGGLFIAGTNAATTVNFTGSLSGSVGSVTGAVGSVTGLTASNLDVAVSTRMATFTQPTGFLAATFPATVASTTNITAGTITTVTNLTNAPTAGDLTATMKASVTTAATAATPTAAAVTGAVGSVTGNVGGNVTGSVGSVVGLTAANLDVAVSTRLAAAGYTAPDNTSIATLTGRLTAGRALLLDNLDAAISTRLATAGYVAPLDATSLRAAVGLASANLDTQLSSLQTTATAIKGKTDSLSFTVAGQADVNLLSVKGHLLAGSGSGPYG